MNKVCMTFGTPLCRAFLWVFGAYGFRMAYLSFSALLTNAFSNALYSLGIICAGLAVTVFVLSRFKIVYWNCGSGASAPDALITLILSVCAAVFYIVTARQHIYNALHGLDRYLIFLFIPISCVILAILSAKAFTVRKCKNKQPRLPAYKHLVYGLTGVMALYSLASLAIVPLVWKNISRCPFGFAVLLLLFFIAIFDFCVLLKIKLFSNRKIPIFSLILNLSGIVLYALAEWLKPSFFVEIAKPFAPLTFAASISVFHIFYLVLCLGCAIYSAKMLNRSEYCRFTRYT